MTACGNKLAATQPLPAPHASSRPCVPWGIARVHWCARGLSLTPCGSYDCLKLPVADNFPTDCLFVPSGWVGDAPSLWRWKDGDRTMIEVSCVRVDSTGNIDSRIFAVPSWLRSAEDLEAWLRDPTREPSPAQRCAIGFALSFAWRMNGFAAWASFVKATDLATAKRLFEQSAAAGYWAALNNLGVMYEHGIGVPVDKIKAFELYRQAAESLEARALEHLARCYREGIGCVRNIAEADFLDELRAAQSLSPAP